VSEDIAALADAAAKLLQSGDYPAGLRMCRAALARVPDHADLLHMSAIAAAQTQRLPRAVVLLKRTTAVSQASALATRHLAGILNALGRRGEEADAHRTLLRFDPLDVVTLVNLGAALLAAGRSTEASSPLRQAAALSPEIAEIHHNLADALAGSKRVSEWLRLETRALAIRASFPEALNGLGLAFRKLDRPGDALACFRRAVELRPDYAEAQNNLGNALHLERRIGEAVARYRRAIILKPADAAPHQNLGNASMDRGDVVHATIVYRRSLAIDPGNAACDTALIFALDMVSGVGFAEQQAERRRWYLRHGRPYAAQQSPHANDRTPDRRLRLGFVSADFRQHAAASIFGPILRRLDPAQFEIACYSAVVREDAMTEQFRRLSHSWQSTLDLSPAELADRIRKDAIDILVDLSGHSSGNRLLTFAAKPAPVQVTAWGHGTGTGIPAIDYFFADPIVASAEMRSLFAERIYDLPCFLCFEAPDDAPPVVPTDPHRVFTFGCFNRASKIGEATAEAWGRILAAVPGSRLLLKDPTLDDGVARAEVMARLARHGVAASRIETRGRTARREHLANFADVDLALDPFPQNGGVSTFEAIHMGIPVVSLLGTTLPGRSSASILSAIGLSDWVARTTDEYVGLAIGKAATRTALADFRLGLRQQLLSSETGDPARYTAAVASAFRTIWQRWCAS